MDAMQTLKNHPAVEDVRQFSSGLVRVWLASGWWVEGRDGLDAYTVFTATNAGEALALLADEDRVYQLPD